MIVFPIGSGNGPYGWLVQSKRTAMLVDPFSLDDALKLVAKKRTRLEIVVFTRPGTIQSRLPAGSIACKVFAPGPIADATFAHPASRDAAFSFGGRRWKIAGAKKSQHVMVGSPQSKLLFSGDVVLGIGSGCEFLRDESQACVGQMFRSLQSLSESTRIYGAFDFGEVHTRYCEELLSPKHPSWRDLYRQERAALRKRRASGDLNYPTMLGYERAFNPFLTAKSKTGLAKLSRDWVRRFEKLARKRT